MKLRKLLFPALLSTWFFLQTGPWAQAYSGYYYVKPSSISLRECPANNAPRYSRFTKAKRWKSWSGRARAGPG